jgi:threonine/homoserine/homoserine lactone efflux protein
VVSGSAFPEGAGVLIRGLAIGVSIAAPVGPIGVLCIRRTLAEGRTLGLATGLGAAVADAVYGAVAALGLTAVSAALVGQQEWIRLIGGTFLLWLGITTYRSRPAGEAAAATGTGLAGAFASTFALTLTNPMTILSFVAVFAGLGLGSGAGSALAALLMVAGVFLGSAAWWLALSTIVDRLRGRFDARGLTWVNRISGLVITAFGLIALASLRFHR